MPADEGAPQPAPRPLRAVWWWFLVHGLMAAAFGAFVLATPFADAAGFVLDGLAFAVLVFIGGTQTTIQAILYRDGAPGSRMFLAIGIHSMAAGIVLWVLGSLGLATALFWSIVGFLVLEGLLLVIGLRRSAVYRVWGALMGGCMLVAVGILTVAWLADPAHSYDIPDAGMGVAGMLYGVAVFVAALQARAGWYRADPTARAR